MFAGGSHLPVGAAEQHGFRERAGNLFGLGQEEVKADWARVVGQMKYLVEHVDAVTDDYELSEVQFQLGFSAQGTIVFIAQAGISATISATFKRKQDPAVPLHLSEGR